MAANVAPFMPTPAEVAACKWLTDEEVNVYVTEERAVVTPRELQRELFLI